MGLKLRWCYEPRILLLEGIGYLKAADFAAIEAELRVCLADSSQKKVHLLLDMNRVAALPSVQEWNDFDWLQSEQIGWILIIGLYQIEYQVLMTIVMQLTRQQNRFFSTRKKALSFLSLLEPDLPQTPHCPDDPDDTPESES